uniref:Transposase of ISCARN83, IS1595 family ISNwi1 group n=1 Tax=mine drainage metagenome TaxID=410659 RepID=E6QIN7_9ZZZZ
MNRWQTVKPEQKYTVTMFDREFPSEDACLEYVKEQRFPGGVALCVNCKVERKHYRVSARTSYACHACGNHIYPLAGTIFHKSTTSLRTWFLVIRLMASTRVGISAKHIQRETGVTYKTAWRMMKQVRKLMEDRITLSGPVEIDEAEFGGADSNKPKHLRGKAKMTALGIVERGGRVVAQIVPNITALTLCSSIAETVEPDSPVFTDLMHSYNPLGVQFEHQTVNHSVTYVDGPAHTNTIDGFWSLVKRGITGVYYQVGAEYLQSYLNEYAFRYNRRKVMRPMFSLLAERTVTQVCPSAREQKLLGS